MRDHRDLFINNTLKQHQGGDLYINLSNISEDVLKDGKKFFENGLPLNGEANLIQQTIWGKVPTQQNTVLTFANETETRQKQDVGFDGLMNEEEKSFATYSSYLQQLRAAVSPSVLAKWESDIFSPLNDPSGDNYHHYRGADYDNAKQIGRAHV